MKTKTYTLMMLTFSVLFICALNLQGNVTESKKIAVITNTFHFFTASANVIDEEEHVICNGATCDEANGLKYATFGYGDLEVCCGLSNLYSGKKMN